MRSTEAEAMAHRHKRLRERPKCERFWSMFNDMGQCIHVHRCRKIRNHAHRECKCHCGDRKVR